MKRPEAFGHRICTPSGVTTPDTTVLDYSRESPLPDKSLRVIATLASCVFIAISVTAKVATYRVNPLFLIPLMWAPYLFRRPLFLTPLHYVLFAVAILIHDLGAYG